MNKKELQALRLMEELDGLRDDFIEAAMLPDDEVSKGTSRATGISRGFRRIMKNGLVAALLAGVLYLGLLAAIVRLGQPSTNDAVAPEGSPPENGTYEDTTPPVTQETPTIPEEEERVEPGTVSVDENGLTYVSNGDGTCICKGFVEKEGQTTLHIPNYSPDGDVVVELDSFSFRTCYELTEVILPDGLRELDHNTFPMEAPIYTVYGNILYLPSHSYPYMAAVATIGERPALTSPAVGTRIIACHAFTYDVSTYFALHWQDQIQTVYEKDTFTIPSSVIHIGDYGLTDVGKPITYSGFLVGWDSLTAGAHKNLIRTVSGEPVPVQCLDGTTVTVASEPADVWLSGSPALGEDGALYGGYLSYAQKLNPDYYAWMANPDEFDRAPDQFITVQEIFGTQSRVLTAEELRSAHLSVQGAAAEALTEFLEAYNRDPTELYKGCSVVMIHMDVEAFYHFTVAEIVMTPDHVHVVFERLPDEVIQLRSQQFVLIPVDDPAGRLADATVSFEIQEPSETVTEAIPDESGT